MAEGYERLNTWEALGYNTTIQLGERFSLKEKLLESEVSEEVGREGRAPLTLRASGCPPPDGFPYTCLVLC